MKLRKNKKRPPKNLLKQKRRERLANFRFKLKRNKERMLEE